MRIITVLLIAFLFLPAYGEEKEEFIKVKGRVNIEGEAKGIGMIAFFNKEIGPMPDLEYYVRVPDYVFELEKDNTFNGKISKGEYYIGISLNEKGKESPLKKGDYYFIFKDTFNFTEQKEYDIGLISAKPSKIESFKVKTAIEGIVVDENGKPVENVYVFAFLKSAKRTKPLYISEPTDSKGRFMLRLGGSGSYYLKVRERNNAGTPKQNSIIGVYGGREPKEVHVTEGEIIKGIEIKAERIGVDNNIGKNTR